MFKKILIATSVLINIFFISYLGYKYSLTFINANHNIYYDYVKSRSSLFETLTITPRDTVFTGASIMQHAEWQEYFPEHIIKNRAIAGATSEDILLMLPSIIEKKPEKIVIMVGFNDLNRGRSVSSVVQTYQSILDIFKNTSSPAKLVLLSISPVNLVDSIVINKKIVDVNRKVKELCENPLCDYIDVHRLLSGDAGQLAAKYTYDGVHLTGSAYLVIANALKKVI